MALVPRASRSSMRIAVNNARTSQASSQAIAAKNRTATINARMPGSSVAMRLMTRAIDSCSDCDT